MSNAVKTIDDFLSRELLENNLETVDLEEMLAPRRVERIVNEDDSWIEDAEDCFVGDYVEADPRHSKPARKAIRIDYFEPDEDLEEQARNYIEDTYSRLLDEDDERSYNPIADASRLFSNAFEAVRRLRDANTGEMTYPAFVVTLPFNYDSGSNPNQVLGPSEIERVIPRPEQLKNDDLFSTEYRRSDNDKVSVLTDDPTIYVRNIQDLIRGVDKSSEVPGEFYKTIDEQIEVYTGISQLE